MGNTPSSFGVGLPVRRRATSSPTQGNPVFDKDNEEKSRHESLAQFSSGKISYRKLMRSEGMQSDEELFLAMANAGLPMPSLSEDEIKEMLQNFDKVLDAAGL